MKFQSIKTSELDKKQIDQILNLKNTYWKYGYESQLTWFKKNSHKNDVHNLIIINDEIVGYTFLGSRTFEILHLSKIIKKLPYILFETLILSYKYRNFFYVSKLMKFNSKIINKKKNPSFLLCHNPNVKLYKFFGWSSINVSDFKVPDHPRNLKGMVYNFDNFKQKADTIYNFYCYS